MFTFQFRKPLLWFSSILIAVTFLVFVIGQLISAKPPLDQTLEKNFYANENNFSKLIYMAHEDKNMDRIAPTFTRTNTNWNWPRPLSELGISISRWNEYKTIFQQIGVTDGIQREKIDQHDCIFLFAYNWGLAIGGGGLSKGYVYCDTNLSPLVNSLKKPDPNHTLYKKLKGNWYLFLG